jgi:hypothetical protein
MRIASVIICEQLVMAAYSNDQPSARQTTSQISTKLYDKGFVHVRVARLPQSLHTTDL